MKYKIIFGFPGFPYIIYELMPITNIYTKHTDT